MARLVALSVVLIMSGLPLLTVFCDAVCPSPMSQKSVAACHEHDQSDGGARMTSRHHDCDHHPSVKAAVITELRLKTTVAGWAMPVAAPADHRITPDVRSASLRNQRGSPPRSAPSAFSVLRI